MIGHSMSQYEYALCGWQVRSSLPLPELIPWPGPPKEQPDLTIAEGDVPERLQQPVNPENFVTVGADGSVLLKISGTVRFLVRQAQITVQFLGLEAEDSWRTFLFGSVLSYVCHLRGLLPLHAACLRVNGRAIALIGHSGSGKSTLALALLRRGHELISDDLTILHNAGGAVEILPAFPRLKLWRDSLADAGVKADDLPRVRPGIEKYVLNPDVTFSGRPGRVDALFVLDEGDEPRMERIRAAAAIPVIVNHVTRPLVCAWLGRRPGMFAQVAEIANQAAVFKLTRPKQFHLLDDTCAMVEDVCRQ